MKPIVVIKEADGKVHLTPEEIQKIVDDAYNTGYSDGDRRAPAFIQYPYYWDTKPIVYTTDHTITCHLSGSDGA